MPRVAEAISKLGVDVIGEAVKAALSIEDPFDRVKAWLMIQRFIECPPNAPQPTPIDVQEISAPSDILAIIGDSDDK